MPSYKPRVLSMVVAALHIAWTIRILSFISIDLIDFTDEDNQQLSEDGIFDMPIPGVRYLLLLWLLVFFASVILTVGIIMKRPIMLALFLITMMTFIVIFLAFGTWGVVDSLLNGIPFGSIVEELIYDSALLVVEFVILHPVYLLYLELIEPADNRPSQSAAANTIRVSVTNCDQADNV